MEIVIVQRMGVRGIDERDRRHTPSPPVYGDGTALRAPPVNHVGDEQSLGIGVGGYADGKSVDQALLGERDDIGR